jgi:hypothetical protein
MHILILWALTLNEPQRKPVFPCSGGCEVNRPDDAGRLPLHWTATKVAVAPQSARLMLKAYVTALHVIAYAISSER